MNKLATIIGVSFFFLSGCGIVNNLLRTSNDRRVGYVESHNTLNKKTSELILEGKISLGMTPDQVRASWGPPNDINETVGAWGVHAQWVYGSQYVYFENDVLTSWQN